MKAGLSWLRAAPFLSLICTQISTSVAQAPLPTPAWTPPPAASGAISSANANRPNRQWSTLLGDLIYFYDAQRSGNFPASNRVVWRNDSLLNDGQGSTDLSGGYYDAGDYIKATLPLAWSLNSICWGVLEFGNGYQDANQTAYLDSMLRWGLDWLIKAHPQPNTLYVLVGDDRRDNDYWGGDQNIPTPRPTYQINDTHPGTDVAAATSAAFSSCALVYANKTLSSASIPIALINATYSDVLLTHSRQLLSFAVNATAGMQFYQKAVPEIADIYPSTSYYDDLAFASIFLGVADSSPALLQLAKTYWDKGSLAQGDLALTWDDKNSAIPVLMAEALSSLPTLSSAQDINVWKAQAEKMLDQIVAAKGPGHLTDGGLLYFDGSSDFASLNPALNAAMLLIKYAPLATTTSKTNDYLAFAKLQLDYALGNNPMQMPYVVGINPNSPQNPHSAPASGGSDVANINTSPPQEAYVLYGAVVGGPDKNDDFWDERRDWVQTEVALDYNAPLLTLAAWKVATDGNDPYYTRLQDGAYAANRPAGTSRPCSNPDVPCPNNNPYDFSRGEQIAVGVVFGLGGLAVLVMGLWYIRAWLTAPKKAE
ncbi:hypothetical protein FRC17_009160 [Serendipita sp. 399]|nr:hypothetical protein FRC17_009160 [Serendipita sp. 399]